jgi:capsular exopolysaccharide synthesis family protein
MSKIERALRKAEEERRKKAPPPRSHGGQERDVLITAEGIAEPQETRPSLTHLSEHFRKIAARLKTCCENVGANDVLFTSAVSGEGKTTNAVNCALSLCQDFNLSVCLVDCDLRKPNISGYFPGNETVGITDVLKGQAEIGSAIQPTPINGLSIVYSRRIGRHALPLLSSDRLKKIVQDLRGRFDFVIFDAPPILPLADSAVLSKNVSALVLVIESGRTRRKHIEQIFDQIDCDKVIGFIMNYKKYKIPMTYNYSKYYDYGAGKTPS